jgi:hypothetical protein
LVVEDMKVINYVGISQGIQDKNSQQDKNAFPIISSFPHYFFISQRAGPQLGAFMALPGLSASAKAMADLYF